MEAATCDVRGMLSGSLQDCNKCDVKNQPDPEKECETCLKMARETREQDNVTLVSRLISPATEWLLELREMINGGCRMAPDDLPPATWKALGVIEREINARQLEQARERRHSKN